MAFKYFISDITTDMKKQHTINKSVISIEMYTHYRFSRQNNYTLQSCTASALHLIGTSPTYFKVLSVSFVRFTFSEIFFTLDLTFADPKSSVKLRFPSSMRCSDCLLGRR